ncbi:type II secretion system protein GspD [Aurantiacibacter flavus]|uniref:Type II and III secretion system protein n=1 Tax=Aurantiacibacter flavus TaxID=3145232 RepID=A0ABV0CZI1_9SPHN
MILSKRERTMRPLALIMAFSSLGTLSACMTPLDMLNERDAKLKEATEVSMDTSNEALAELVEKAKDKAERSGDFDDYVDYHYLKSASARLLYLKVNSLLAEGKQEEAVPFVREGLRIAPQHIGLLKVAAQIDTAQQTQYVLDGLAPTSRSARVINRMFDRRMLYARGFRFPASSALDDFTDDNLTPYRDYYDVLNKPLNELMAGASENAVSDAFATGGRPSTDGALRSVSVTSVLDQLRMDLRIPVAVHESAFGVIRQHPPITLDGDMSALDLLKVISERAPLNTVMGPFGLFIFAGPDIPASLDNGQRVFTLRAEYRPTATIITGLRAVGFSQNLAGVDEDSSTIWFRGSIGEYLRAIEYISTVDTPPSEVQLNVEVVEIEESLIQEIGARIPQRIDFNLADPTYRQYIFSPVNGSTPDVLGNSGIIVNNNTSGSVSMANLLNQSVEDVVRAVVTDGSFSAAAREKKYKLNILERPTLRLRSGIKGRIDVGGRLPVITATATSSGFVSEQVTYVNAGIMIEATSRLAQDEKLHLDLKLTTSNLVKMVTSPSGSSAPQLSNREVQTSLVLRDGETALIGGISSFKGTNENDGLPGLARSRITSVLGGSTGFDQSRSELMMFITPEIVAGESYSSRNWIGIDGGGGNTPYVPASGAGAPTGRAAPASRAEPAGANPGSASEGGNIEGARAGRRG